MWPFGVGRHAGAALCTRRPLCLSRFPLLRSVACVVVVIFPTRRRLDNNYRIAWYKKKLTYNNKISPEEGNRGNVDTWIGNIHNGCT